MDPAGSVRILLNQRPLRGARSHEAPIPLGLQCMQVESAESYQTPCELPSVPAKLRMDVGAPVKHHMGLHNMDPKQ